MNPNLHPPAERRPARWLPAGVTLLTLLVFGAAIGIVTLYLRRQIHQQIVRQNGELMHAVAMMHAKDAAEEQRGDLGGPEGQLPVLLKTSRLKGVVAARLFDVAGRFVASFPVEVTDGLLASTDLAALGTGRPVCRFHPRARLADYFVILPDDGLPRTAAPLLEVNIPLQMQAGDPIRGVAQFIIEGQTVAEELATADRHLTLQASAVFSFGALILLAALGWAFLRLQAANRELARRTTSLLEANQELALRAKTSALGAVTAHLLHGLRNPLSGLESFVNGHAAAREAGADEDWQSALATTRRLQSLVNETARVLREEEGSLSYEISLAEMLELVSAKARPIAAEAGVRFVARLETAGTLDNRSANLILLILFNLLQNAIQATPNGRAVTLSAIEGTAQCVECRVADEGPGISDAIRSRLFAPVRSGKDGGSGIGLAISKQLAEHLGAGLELRSSSPAGSLFVLTLPADLFREASPQRQPAASAPIRP